MKKIGSKEQGIIFEEEIEREMNWFSIGIIIFIFVLFLKYWIL